VRSGIEDAEERVERRELVVALDHELDVRRAHPLDRGQIVPRPRSDELVVPREDRVVVERHRRAQYGVLHRHTARGRRGLRRRGASLA
jgi:hypothetical protein